MITLSGFPNNGRLGNQLFQLAAAYGHARNLGTNVSIQDWPAAKYFPKIWNYIKRSSARHAVSIRDNVDLTYSPLPKRDNVSLWGYYQCEAYWQGYEKEVIDMFTFSHVATPKPQNVIALNIRGGDFRKLRQHYAEITGAYYAECIKQSGCDAIHVYTDDVEYAKQLLYAADIWDFELFPTDPATNMPEMASYFYLAGSNSTYSWWSGYLNQIPGATVYAPSKWFPKPNPKNLQERDMISKRFTIIHNG